MDVVTHAGRPFPHWLVRELLPPGVAEAAALAPPPPITHRGWVRYDNDDERQKWAVNDLHALGPAWRNLYAELAAPAFVAELSALTGVPDLQPDPSLHGAGLHVMFAGGHLSPHIDAALHPRTGLERRVNLILCLNPDHWCPASYGGRTVLRGWDGQAATVTPEYCRALVWCCGDDTIHGVEPIGRGAPPRLTAAAYYWSAPRPGATRRTALFLPRRT